MVDQSMVGRLAGVSGSAVSLALRGRPGVGADTRERIIRVARDLGYSPHGVGRALSSGRTGLIGVVPGLSPWARLAAWETAVMEGMVSVLSERGMEAIIAKPGEGESVPRSIAGSLADGAAFFPGSPERVLKRTALRMPCVLLAFDVDCGADSVRADDDGGIREAIEYLAFLGHRKMAYVNTPGSAAPGPAPDGRRARTRREAYLAAMAERGLSAAPGSDEQVPVETRMARLLDHDKPTAYICHNDFVAMRVIRHLHRRGMRVPRDASVVGIDDVGNPDLYSPAISTVHAPYREMGVRAVEMLLARMSETGSARQREILPETLRIRESTAPPAG